MQIELPQNSRTKLPEIHYPVILDVLRYKKPNNLNVHIDDIEIHSVELIPQNSLLLRVKLVTGQHFYYSTNNITLNHMEANCKNVLTSIKVTHERKYCVTMRSVENREIKVKHYSKELLLAYLYCYVKFNRLFCS